LTATAVGQGAGPSAGTAGTTLTPAGTGNGIDAADRDQLAALLGALLPSPAIGQAPARTPAPPLWLVADGDAVVAQLSRVPEPFWGFHLYRADPGGEWVRLTDEAVQPVRDPGLSVSILGEDAPLLQELTRSATPVEMVRRIQLEPATANVYSYLFPTAAEVLGRRFRDPGLQPGATYRYRAVFTDPLGAETEESVEGSVTLSDVVPGTVAGMSAAPGSARTTVTWSYPAYQGDPTDLVVGYHVYRATAPEGPYQRLTAAPVARNDLEAPSFTDREAENGVRYLYRVRAVDLLRREGPVSDTAAVTPEDPTPPAAPEGLAGLPGDGVAQVAWRISPELDLAGYWVERSTGLDQPYARLNTDLVAGEAPIWVDSTVVGGTQYFYRVVAQDAAGRESRASNAIPVLPYDRTPPAAPGAVTASVAERRVRLTWGPAPGSDVAGYHVYRGDTPETLVRVTEQPVPDTTFLDMGFEGEGLVPGAELLVRVTAVDGAFNESEPASLTVTVPDDVAPAPPTGLTLENPYGRGVRVRWNAARDLDVARYVVLRDPGAGGALLPLDSVDAADRYEVDDAGVRPGVTYRYAVLAVDRAGNRGEPAADTLTFRDASPPAGPNFVQAALIPGGVRILWERVAAEDLAGYRVHRSELPTG
ncbi:MAG: hypothetical protein RQ751_14260, partial [Longimicrobiales bacterium]|nr:hypothetical protein [Longimicrobiales bacterium]